MRGTRILSAGRRGGPMGGGAPYICLDLSPSARQPPLTAVALLGKLWLGGTSVGWHARKACARWSRRSGSHLPKRPTWLLGSRPTGAPSGQCYLTPSVSVELSRLPCRRATRPGCLTQSQAERMGRTVGVPPFAVVRIARASRMTSPTSSAIVWRTSSARWA